MRLNNNLIYRVYNNSVAILMDVKQNNLILLEDEALALWLTLKSGTRIDDAIKALPAFVELTQAGVIEAPIDNVTGLNPENKKERIDLSVLNLWAFKNHIPLSGHFELTGRCNLRCKHCYCLFEHQKDILSTAQVLSILDDLRDSGTFGLVLTGGEIFFRDDIMEILNHLNENHFIIRINTNGTYINEKIVQQLSQFNNIYRIHVSIYGADAKTHDTITNSRGSFDKTINALKLMKAAGLNLRINCSLMQENFDSYKRIKLEIGDKLSIPVHYDSVIFPKDDGSLDNTKDELNQEQTESFMFDREQKNDAVIKKPKLCKAGFSFFSICEDGSLYPCLKMKRYYKNPLGNLQTDKFNDIWNHSGAIQQIRSILTDKLRDCNVCDISI